MPPLRDVSTHSQGLKKIVVGRGLSSAKKSKSTHSVAILLNKLRGSTNRVDVERGVSSALTHPIAI